MKTPQHIGMAGEIRQAPEAVRRQEQALAEPLAAVVQRLTERSPAVVVTCARGSSAHAAAFAKHAIERHLGIPVAPAAPSITTVYHRDLKLKDQLLLAISQSGRSDDLVEQARSARRAGAVTAAFVNAADSPLAEACEFVLPLSAGIETSVAATKSFVATLAAILRLTAAWAGEGALSSALARLPERLTQAAELDWSACFDAFARATSLICIGRGPTLSIAREAALKLKEVCNLHAEGFSGAEFQHGPVALVTTSYPILMFMPGDDAASALRTFAADLKRKHAALFCVEPGGQLPALAGDQAEADAICVIQSFYAAAVQLAKLKGLDPDSPRHLQKVTRTR